GNVVDLHVAESLKDVDALFLCADSMQSRLVFNALVHQYLIPGFQVGSKVSVDEATKNIDDIFVVSRPVLPFGGGGCLLCNGLISASRLQNEAVGKVELRQQGYVADPEIASPSVITLNALASAQSVNDFFMSYLGLRDLQS